MNHRIIARLDIKGSNLVKGIHLEGLRVLGKPEQFAKYYYETGADELMYVDVVASLYGRNSLHDIITKTAKEIFIPLTVGGGIRTIGDIRKVLRAGADKVSLNSAAIRNPQIIKDASRIFGSSTIVVSIEAKKKTDGTYEAYIDNGREKTGIDVFDWAKKVVGLGAGEIVLTSIDNEGTGKGFDNELTSRVVRVVSVPVIACGGGGSKEQVKDVIDASANAVGLASLLHYNFVKKLSAPAENSPNPFNQNVSSRIKDISIPNLKKYLVKNSINCRF